LELEIAFYNRLTCAWKGEAYSNLYAEQMCQHTYGTGAMAKTFGGCIGDEDHSDYVFEVLCE
jgi:hypothetical protein